MVASVVVGCAAATPRPGPPTPASAAPVAACALAPLAAATALEGEGRLLRAERTLRAAEKTCADPHLAAATTALAATLGRTPGPKVDAAARAAARARVTLAVAAGLRGDHDKALALFLEAAALAPPHGDALFGAGLASRALGREAAARALLDRARVALEAEGGARARLEVDDGLDAPVVGARFLGDDVLALAAGADVVLRAGPERRRVRRLRGSATVRALAGDAQVLVTAGADGVVRAFDVAGGLARGVCRHEGDALAVDRTAAGLVASGGTDRVVRLTRDDGVAVGTLVGHTQPITALAFSPDGRLLASAGRDRTVRLWDVATRVVVRVLPNPGAVLALAWSPTGHLLATATTDRTVRVYDPSTGWPVATLAGHAEHALALAFAPDGRTLASGSADHTVRLWDVATSFALRKTLEGHTAPVLALAFDPAASSLVSAGSDRTAVLWSPTTGAHQGLVTEHTSATHALAFAPDGALAVGSADATIRLLGPKGAALRTLEGHVLSVSTVAFSADGKRLVSGGEDDAVRLWDATSGAALGKIGKHVGAVTSVGFTGVGEPLSAGRDGRLLRHPHGKKAVLVRKEAGPIAALAVAGDTYATASEVGVSTPWAAPSTSTLALAALPGGGLAAGDAGGAVRLFGADYAHAYDLFGHTGAVRSLAVDPTHGWLASASDDGFVRLWDLVEHAPLAADRLHPRGARAVAFSPDGLLASGGEDGVVWVRRGGKRLFSLHAIGGEPTGFAVTDGGRVQLFGDEARRFLTCAIGPVEHPLALCEEEVVVPDLVARTLAGAPVDD